MNLLALSFARDRCSAFLFSFFFTSLLATDYKSSPVPLSDLYFDLISFPVAPIVSSAGSIV